MASVRSFGSIEKDEKLLVGHMLLRNLAPLRSGESDEVVKHAWCAMCGPARTNCSTLCTVRDGKFIASQGNPKSLNNGGRGGRTLCAKGLGAAQMMYSSKRILYPMMRTNSKTQEDPGWMRISWDKALDTIASKLMEQKRLYGPESFGVLSPQYFAVLGSVGRRFLNVHGSPNYLHSGICATQRRFSRLVTIGGDSLAKAVDTATNKLVEAKLIVNWGSNAENSAVNQGYPANVLEAKDRGLTMVDIRPLLDPLAAKADVWVPLRPGTDCALAMTILHVLIIEDLYDHAFVEEWCEGFDQLADHVAGCTPEWGELMTGVPAGRIMQVARLMGTTKPMGIVMGNGIGDQQNDGHWAVACVCLISAITGNLGIAGGGGTHPKAKPPKPLINLGKVDALSHLMPPNAQDIENGWMPGVSKLVAPETPRWFQAMRTQESGPTSAYFKGLMSVLTEDPYPLRAVLAQATNPLSATRQPQKVAQALEKLDFYVVMDTEWNSSCRYADVVLPACTSYEASDVIALKNGPKGTFLGINQQLCAPFGESRSDWTLYLELAVRMGYGEHFWQGSVDAMLSERLQNAGVTLEELRERGYVFVPRENVAGGATAELNAEATAVASDDMDELVRENRRRMFASLPNGKVQCAGGVIGGKPTADGTGVLAFLPQCPGAAESFGSTPELAADYPFVFSDVHAHRLCMHSYFQDIPVLKELKPHFWMKINPASAAAYGIENGDWVEVESRHGSVRLRAELFEGVAPEVLMTKRGWWLPDEERAWGGAEVNELYDADPANFDPFHSGMGKQTLVRIRKIDVN